MSLYSLQTGGFHWKNARLAAVSQNLPKLPNEVCYNFFLTCRIGNLSVFIMPFLKRRTSWDMCALPKVIWVALSCVSCVNCIRIYIHLHELCWVTWVAWVTYGWNFSGRTKHQNDVIILPFLTLYFGNLEVSKIKKFYMFWKYMYMQIPRWPHIDHTSHGGPLRDQYF